ncbi:MAG: hypothetical protein JW769_03260 [Parachlamydiales bacterium]|nr:hypothetical protein [Parachlamydiales bacterium]
MARQTKTSERKSLTVSDAIQNLSAIASVEIDPTKPLGVIKKHKLVIQDENFVDHTILFIVPDNAQTILLNVKKTIKVILEYFRDLYDDPATDWEDERMRHSLQMIMDMVVTAGEKLGEYVSLYPVLNYSEDITDSKEYKDLETFYLKKLSSKMRKELEGDEAWQEEWNHNPKKVIFDPQEAGLYDFETIKQDRNYELFYLTDSDGEPFFTEDLKRNIRLVTQVDEGTGVDFYKDPLIKIREINDKDFSYAAGQILQEIHHPIETFYRLHHHKNRPLATIVHKSVMALMLAANSKNLLTNAIGKSSFSYFEDFCLFLREALYSEEYRHMVAYPEGLEEDQKDIMKCILAISHAFFTRMCGVREEMIGLIFHMMQEGKKESEQGFFSQLLRDDEALRQCLSHYPHGSLLKILDVLSEEQLEGFCPIRQGNYPYMLLEMQFEKKKIKLLHLPSPTTQTTLEDVYIIEEFSGFVRSETELHEKHLLVDLQDKDSSLENHRSRAIEKFCHGAEFASNLYYVSLKKSGDFYHQREQFLKLDRADDFLKIFKEEIDRGLVEHFPFSKEFISKILGSIHEYLFQKKERLSRAERLDFIEIAFQYFLVQCIERNPCSSLSFTNKDGLDDGSVQNFELWAFLHKIQKETFTKSDREMALWLLYAPSLRVRERLVNGSCFTRAISALSYLETLSKELLQKSLKGLHSEKITTIE